MTDRRDAAEIFGAALDVDDARRSSFVEEACGDDAALRAEVESLLHAHGRAGAFLDAPIAPDPAALRDLPAEIGAYRALRELGSGGMGTVYLAERADDQFRKRVAIKILKRGMDTDTIVQRFRTERQVLASLEHPHIARLMDGGATADGRPYLVMEYVDGRPIIAYCRERCLDTPARLELFRKVCAAVHHAHRNLIVHRDLKPGNILVTADGTPKLLDFGIAKVLDNGADVTIPITAPGRHFLTPAYASPEQLRGLPVTTASDVYSMGVVLYEMLTETLPLDVGQLGGPELEQHIGRTAPPRPSTRLAQESGVATPVISRQLRGDIDNIILKALRKEPDRRYESAAQFADDIRRHLDGLPVVARPDTLVYRSTKFVKRHRLAVAASGAIAIALIVGLGTSLSLYVQARTARITAERVSEFLQRMVASVNPDVALGQDDTLLRDMLAATARDVDRELADEPAIAADLHGTIAMAYQALGRTEAAERHARLAVELATRVHGADSAPAAEADLVLVEVLNNLGRVPEARELVDTVVERLNRHSGPAAQSTLTAENTRALVMKLEGQYEAAEIHYRDILRRIGDAPELFNLRTAVLNNLGMLLRERSALDEARTIFEEVLALRRQHLPADHGDIALSLQNLSPLYSTLGDSDRAIAMLEDALAIRRRIHDPGHVNIAVVLHNLGSVQYNAGQLAVAEQTQLEALRIYENKLPKEHPFVASLLNNLGTITAQLGRYDEAIAHHRRALAMRRSLFGEDHHLVATCLNNLASALMAMGHFDEAEPLFDQALAIRRAAYPKNHWLCGLTEHRLADLYLHTARAHAALDLENRAVAAWIEHFPSGHIYRQRAYRQLADIHLALDQVDDAVRALAAAVVEASAGNDDDSVEPARRQAVEGQLLMAQGRPQDAVPLLRAAVAGLESAGPEVDVRVLDRIRRQLHAAQGTARD